MSTTKIYTAIPWGFESQLIGVEADIRKGLPAFNIVGMASRTINESRERIRSAITNSNLIFPKQKILINLAPSGLEKTGTGLDLAISVAILGLSGQILMKNAHSSMFAGELALDGKIRPIRGIINVIECAIRHNFKRIYIPEENAPQAQILASKIRIFPIKNLKDLWLCLNNLRNIHPLSSVVKITTTDTIPPDICGFSLQEQTMRMLEIALAGKHNLLMFGPPGSGKTSLARIAHSLLPPPNEQEIRDIVKLNAIVKNTKTDITRPFREPHHNASTTAILGGGKSAHPGEISLANHGILFLDEFPLFSQQIIDSLREPLESHEISINRADYCLRFPADFILIAAANPCPCGHLTGRKKLCKCSISSIERYRNKLSGPILDRIDIKYAVGSSTQSVYVKTTTISNRELASAKKHIANAYSAQQTRYRDCKHKYNSRLSSQEALSYIKLSKDAKLFLDNYSNSHNLSARSYFKAIKVAQTICDLDNIPHVDMPQIREAISLVDVDPFSSALQR